MRFVIEATEQFKLGIKEFSKTNPEASQSLLFNMRVALAQPIQLKKQASQKLFPFLHLISEDLIAISPDPTAYSSHQNQRLSETNIFLYAKLESERIALLSIGSDISSPLPITRFSEVTTLAS